MQISGFADVNEGSGEEKPVAAQSTMFDGQKQQTEDSKSNANNDTPTSQETMNRPAVNIKLNFNQARSRRADSGQSNSSGGQEPASAKSGNHNPLKRQQSTVAASGLILIRSNSGNNLIQVPEHLKTNEVNIKAQKAHTLITSSSTWRQSNYNLQTEGARMITTQALTKVDINQIVTMVKQKTNIQVQEPYLDGDKWIFELRTADEAEKARNAASESQQNPRLDLLGLGGICMESNSPEPSSGGASGTNRAFYGRLQSDFLDDNDDPNDFNSLMQNHLRVIQEQAESQVESRMDQDENHPTSPISGMKSGNFKQLVQTHSDETDSKSLSQELDKKRFSEDNHTPVNSLSMQLLGVINQSENKKASSFVGQGFSDAMPVPDSSKKKANQSFSSTWNQNINTLQKENSQKKLSSNQVVQDSKDPPIITTVETDNFSDKSQPVQVSEVEGIAADTSLQFQPEMSAEIAFVGGQSGSVESSGIPNKIIVQGRNSSMHFTQMARQNSNSANDTILLSNFSPDALTSDMRNLTLAQQQKTQINQNLQGGFQQARQPFYAENHCSSQSQNFDIQNQQTQQVNTFSSPANVSPFLNQSDMSHNISNDYMPMMSMQPPVQPQPAQVHIFGMPSNNSNNYNPQQSMPHQNFQPPPQNEGITKLANNMINFHGILNGIQTLTTVMIKNIPMRFSQQDLLHMIQHRHSDTFDYFYLPMDLKTRYNRGYAYINFTDPLFILDFYLEFQGLRWNERFKDCHSTKQCSLFYANIQGKDMNIASLQDKNIMKKLENDVKPVIYDTKMPDEAELRNVKQYYSQQLTQQPMLSQHICQLANEINRQIQGEQFRKFMLRKPGQSEPELEPVTTSPPNKSTSAQQSNTCGASQQSQLSGSYHQNQFALSTTTDNSRLNQSSTGPNHQSSTFHPTTTTTSSENENNHFFQQQPSFQHRRQNSDHYNHHNQFKRQQTYQQPSAQLMQQDSIGSGGQHELKFDQQQLYQHRAVSYLEESQNPPRNSNNGNSSFMRQSRQYHNQGIHQQDAGYFPQQRHSQHQPQGDSTAAENKHQSHYQRASQQKQSYGGKNNNSSSNNWQQKPGQFNRQMTWQPDNGNYGGGMTAAMESSTDGQQQARQGGGRARQNQNQQNAASGSHAGKAGLQHANTMQVQGGSIDRQYPDWGYPPSNNFYPQQNSSYHADHLDSTEQLHHQQQPLSYGNFGGGGAPPHKSLSYWNSNNQNQSQTKKLRMNINSSGYPSSQGADDSYISQNNVSVGQPQQQYFNGSNNDEELQFEPSNQGMSHGSAGYRARMPYSGNYVGTTADSEELSNTKSSGNWGYNNPPPHQSSLQLSYHGGPQQFASSQPKQGQQLQYQNNRQQNFPPALNYTKGCSASEPSSQNPKDVDNNSGDGSGNFL